MAFFRYFWVNPDELFLHTLRRSATAAYLIQCVTLAPFMLVFFVLDPQSNPVGPRLGLQLRRGPGVLLPAPQLAGVEGDEGERMSLTTKIREYRVRDKLSQEELAQKVGVRRETIGNLENGKYNPSLKLAMDIAKVFGCTVEELFFFED